jgi:hypothetical protein
VTLAIVNLECRPAFRRPAAALTKIMPSLTSVSAEQLEISRHQHSFDKLRRWGLPQWFIYSMLSASGEH